MKLVDYLSNVYGYDTPIFLKDVRIGRKSKAAIREEFYRATKKGDLSRQGPGVYSLVNKSDDLYYTNMFKKIITNKFIYSSNPVPGMEMIFICGYFSGKTFLHQIGILDKEPEIIEVTTNNTSSKKRIYTALDKVAIIRKPKTEINFTNYDTLQFLDMFHFVSKETVLKNKDLLIDYVREKKLKKSMLNELIWLYGEDTINKLVGTGIVEAFAEDALVSNEPILTIEEIEERIKPVMDRHGINEVYLFGSYARGEANGNSDVDIYCSEGDVTLFSHVDFIEELKDALGKDVDVVFIGSEMHPFFKEQVEKDKLKIC